MNIKLAICYLVIGVLMLSFGFVMLMQFDIREWNTKTIFKARVNFNEVLGMVKSYNENKLDRRDMQLEQDFKKILNNLEYDSYLYLYCKVKEKQRHWVNHPNQQYPITTTLPSIFNLDNDNNKQIFEQNMYDRLEKRKLYLKSIYTYLICKSEKVYFVLIILLTLIGSIFVICGSIRIYLKIYKKNLYQQNQRLEPKKSITDLNEHIDAESLIEEENEATCCLHICFTKLLPTKSNNNNQSAFNRFESTLIQPNSSLILVSNKSKSLGSINQPKLNSAKIERGAPFIYEDLPAFYTNQKSVNQPSNFNTSVNNNSAQNSFDARQAPNRTFLNAQSSLDTAYMRSYLQMPQNRGQMQQRQSPLPIGSAATLPHSSSPIPPVTPVPMIFAPGNNEGNMLSRHLSHNSLNQKQGSVKFNTMEQGQFNEGATQRSESLKLNRLRKKSKNQPSNNITVSDMPQATTTTHDSKNNKSTDRDNSKELNYTECVF